MIYTNRSLEIITNDKGRKLEITDLYNRPILIDIDRNVSDRLISIEGKFHKFLSLEEEKGKLKLVKRKEGQLYIILDLLDYKCFRKNSLLLKPEGTDDFKVLRYYRTSNRCGMCKWGLHILKAPKNKKFSILKIRATSGKEKYLTIYKGYVKMHSDKTIEKYLSKNNINFDIKNTKWELLLKDKK